MALAQSLDRKEIVTTTATMMLLFGVCALLVRASNGEARDGHEGNSILYLIMAVLLWVYGVYLGF